MCHNHDEVGKVVGIFLTTFPKPVINNHMTLKDYILTYLTDEEAWRRRILVINPLS